MKKSTNTKTTTNITVRVQARGGMFLGPDSYGGAIITIRDFESKKELANGFTDNGDSGSRLTSYASTVSPSPIVTPGETPTIYWVSAAASTVNYSVALKLDKPTLLEFMARIPLPDEQADQYYSVTQWVIPGKDLTVAAGFVIEIPGLWVQPEIIRHNKEVKVRAKVTMMCGCEINDDSPWIPEDFIVKAVFKYKDKFQKKLTLSFNDNSQFIGSFTIPKSINGEIQSRVNAFQISTGNSGSAVQII